MQGDVFFEPGMPALLVAELDVPLASGATLLLQVSAVLCAWVYLCGQEYVCVIVSVYMVMCGVGVDGYSVCACLFACANVCLFL